MRRRQIKKNLKREIEAIITPVLREFAAANAPYLMARRRRSPTYDDLARLWPQRRSGRTYVANLLEQGARLGARRGQP